jgi:hypothetical protein
MECVPSHDVPPLQHEPIHPRRLIILSNPSAPVITDQNCPTNDPKFPDFPDVPSTRRHAIGGLENVKAARHN